MKITESQFFDYMNCPALHEMKHVRKLPLNEEQAASRLLTKVSKYFYLNLLNGKICTMSELKKKWDSICLEHSLAPKQALDGMNLLMKFGNWTYREQMVVLDIDAHYIIKTGDVELVGNMGTIMAAPNNKTELVITDFSSKLPDQTLIDMKTKYTLDAYSFEKMYGRPIDGIRIHSVKHDKDFYTTRNQNDYSRLITNIKSIGENIERNNYYTRESFMCSSCPGRDYCKYWTREGEQHGN